MIRVLRYDVPVDDQTHRLDLFGALLHVAARRPEAVEVWAVHDPEMPPTTYHLVVVGTGHPWPPDAVWKGTAVAPHGLVWHLLDVPE